MIEFTCRLSDRLMVKFHREGDITNVAECGFIPELEAAELTKEEIDEYLVARDDFVKVSLDIANGRFEFPSRCQPYYWQ